MNSRAEAVAVNAAAPETLIPGRPGSVPAKARAFARGLHWYDDNILFGEVWHRDGLSQRDRSVVTIAALIARGPIQTLAAHLRLALGHGVTPTEIVEITTHLAFYAGWPCATCAIDVVGDVFASLCITPEQVTSRTSEGLLATDTSAPAGLDSMATSLEELTVRVIGGDLWHRGELSLRDRFLVTISSLIAQSEDDQLSEVIRGGLESGLLLSELSEAVTHLAFYVGWPRAQRAACILSDATWQVRPAASS